MQIGPCTRVLVTGASRGDRGGDRTCLRRDPGTPRCATGVSVTTVYPGEIETSLHDHGISPRLGDLMLRRILGAAAAPRPR